MHAHWFVLSCIRALEPRTLAKPPRVSLLHALSFGKVHIKGKNGPHLDALPGRVQSSKAAAGSDSSGI